jgi:hypothetical protein
MLATTTVGAVDKTIDKRNMTDADGNNYYIVFCARGGSRTGHAFVVWGVEDRQRRLSTSQAYGFYPAQDGVHMIFGSVSGQLRAEAFGSMSQITDRLIVRVNRNVYLATQSSISRWATSDYNLYSNNCINYTMDVARQTGLVVPSKGTIQYPSSYIQSLIRAN